MTTDVVRKRYQFDLAAMQRIAALNYAALQPWLEELDADQPWELSLGPQLHFTVRLMQQAPFTTAIRIQQHRFSQQLPGLKEAQLDVRLYHDARLAEVVACQGVSQLQARYEIPNPQMFHVNEKHQVNLFLRDWIQLIRTHGLQEV